MRKKKETAATDIVVTPGRLKNDPIKVQGTFKGIPHEFIITASPEAWIALQNKCFGSPDTYQYITKGLFKDIFPFINNAATEARGLNKGGKRLFIKALKLQTAIIYGLLIEKKKTEKRKQPMERIISLSRMMFYSVWKEEIDFLKLRGVESSKFDEVERRFYSGYIQEGMQILRGDKQIIAAHLNTLSAFLKNAEMKNLSSYSKNKDYFNEIVNMNRVMSGLLINRGEEYHLDRKQKNYCNLAIKAFPFLISI